MCCIIIITVLVEVTMLLLLLLLLRKVRKADSFGERFDRTLHVPLHLNDGQHKKKNEKGEKI